MKKMFLKLCSILFILVIMGSSFSALISGTVFADDPQLPDSVDNSQSEYFPAIDSQEDLGSCVSWGQTYYQFTYMMNRSMGVPTTPENTFSPSFNFNIINGGRGTGAWDKDGYNTMKEIGSVPLSTVPYNTKEWNNWFATEQVWKEAMQYRIKDYTYLSAVGMEQSTVTSPDDSDIQKIKTLLAQGEVLAVTTPIYAWEVVRIKAHPDVPENDKYIDEYIVRFCDKSGQGHRLALVGYNDNIWTDVNENGKVDSGEMGAFKVANSWGTERHNKGFMWIAYDALNMTSCVKDCPVSGNYRPEAIYDIVSIEVVPYDTDADLYIRYTLNTKDRSQGKVYATATDKDGKEYTLEVGPKRMHGMTFNKFSYDGTTSANDGTMLFALSNIVPEITSETLHEYTWSIKFEDTNGDGNSFTVKNMEIVDESTGRVSAPSNTYPFSLDGSSKTVNFPRFEQHIPETTTSVPETTVTLTTTQTTTVSSVTTDPAESTTVTVTETQPFSSTAVPDVSIVVTEPVETTTQNTIETSTVPTEITSTEIITYTTESVSTEETITTAVQSEEYIYGDANNDGIIKISDATLIQKFAAHLVDENSVNLKSADCNIDSKVNVKDATFIQKYLAKLEGSAFVGEKYTVEVTYTTNSNETTASVTETTVFSTETVAIVTEPTEVITTATLFTDPEEIVTTVFTEPESSSVLSTETIIITTETAPITTSQVITTDPTETATEAPITTTTPVTVVSNTVTFTNSFGWQGQISCYYWSDSDQAMINWPGSPMQNIGKNDFGEDLYSIKLPDGVTYIIFTNGSVQTVDIPFSGGEQKFYPVSASNDGKYTVNYW